MLTALSVFKCRTDLSAKCCVSCSPCRVSKCSAAMPSVAAGRSVDLRFHLKSKPTLSSAHAAIATAAGNQLQKGLPRTVSVSRGQRRWTGSSSSVRARARIASREYCGSVRACLRSRTTADTPRNSSMWTGEVLNQVARAAESRASSDPSSFPTNHSPACSAIAARLFSSLEFTVSTHPRHAAPTMTEPLRHVFLRHLRGHPEVHRDLPKGEFVCEAQLHRGSALRA